MIERNTASTAVCKIQCRPDQSKNYNRPNTSFFSFFVTPIQEVNEQCRYQLCSESQKNVLCLLQVLKSFLNHFPQKIIAHTGNIFNRFWLKSSPFVMKCGFLVMKCKFVMNLTIKNYYSQSKYAVLIVES